LDTTDIEVDWQQPVAAIFKAAMDDDFNTPEAIAVLFDLANQVNKSGSLEEASLLKKLAGILGLLQRNPESYLQGEIAAGGISQDQIEALINQRLEAKRNKDFAFADSIRKQLLEDGIVLEDTSSGTTWRRD